jgi:hypothetical protein
MNLTVTIESAELQFKQILEEFFISVYVEKALCSHGIDHHRRVWSYTKELPILLDDQKPAFISQLPSKLIIACYMHDKKDYSGNTYVNHLLTMPLRHKSTKYHQE